MKNLDRYPSRYSNGKDVSAAQYITEIICEKKANKEKKDLHYRFWTNKYWAAYYRNQIGSANKLLQKYSAKAIVAALNSEKAKNIYSLRAPHLLAIIEESELQLKSQNNTISITIDRKTDKKFIKSKNITNIISKLEEIDNDS